jgi:acyl-CoA hydrolase
MNHSFANFASSQESVRKITHFQVFSRHFCCVFCEYSAAGQAHMNAALIGQRPRAGAFSTPVFPAAANHYGTLFAGEALSLMSRAALLAAAEHAGGDVVVAACSGITFRSPVRVGEVLHLSARVVRSGRASMTVSVEGSAGRLGGCETAPVLEGLFQMVAVDANGRPRRFPTRGNSHREVA